MAFIQNTITDLDDLLIQATDIDDNGTDTITITTAVDSSSVIANGETIVIMGTGTALDGSWTVGSITGTTITISSTTGGAISNATGQIIVDNGDGTYDTLEIAIDCTAVNKHFVFNVAGNLSVDGSGVTGQALYSFFKYLWTNVPSITKFDFPMLSITNEQFEFIDDWEPATDTDRKKLRTCGWAETTAAGVPKRKWFGFVSLGTIGSTDVPYFVQQPGFTQATANTTYTGPANEPIKFYEDTNADGTPDFDYKDFFKVFVRTRGKTYTSSQISDIGVSELTYIVYRFPLSNGNDLNIQTGHDNAFDGATISTIDGDATTITVTTSAPHGLYVGAPVTISGTTNYNGDFTVATVTGDNTTSTEFTIASTSHDLAAENAGTTKLTYVDTIDLEYLTNPDSSTGNVRIRGDYTQGETYALGDVVFDVDGSMAATKNWYYLDVVSGTPGSGLTMAADASTWTAWDQVSGFGERNIEKDSTIYSAYSAILDLNNGGVTPGAPKEIAYEWAQYKLRSTTTIDIGATRNGDIADTIVYFVGSQLHTYANSLNEIGGVIYPYAVVADDISGSDVNSITYHEAVLVDSRTSDAHFAPTVVEVTIQFNSNLAYAGTDAVFYAYYTSGTNPFGTAGAVQVVDDNLNNVGDDVGHSVPSSGVYTFNYAYTSDATNGRTPDEDVNITIVAIGLEEGQYVTTTGDIKSTATSFSVVAPLERNYDNPV